MPLYTHLRDYKAQLSVHSQTADSNHNLDIEQLLAIRDDWRIDLIELNHSANQKNYSQIPQIKQTGAMDSHSNGENYTPYQVSYTNSLSIVGTLQMQNVCYDITQINHNGSHINNYFVISVKDMPIRLFPCSPFPPQPPFISLGHKLPHSEQYVNPLKLMALQAGKVAGIGKKGLGIYDTEKLCALLPFYGTIKGSTLSTWHLSKNDVISVGSFDGTIRLVDFRDQKGQVFKIKAHTDSVFHCQFSSSNTIVSSARRDENTYLWDVRMGQSRKAILWKVQEPALGVQRRAMGLWGVQHVQQMLLQSQGGQKQTNQSIIESKVVKKHNQQLLSEFLNQFGSHSPLVALGTESGQMNIYSHIDGSLIHSVKLADCCASDILPMKYGWVATAGSWIFGGPKENTQQSHASLHTVNKIYYTKGQMKEVQEAELKQVRNNQHASQFQRQDLIRPKDYDWTVKDSPPSLDYLSLW